MAQAVARQCSGPGCNATTTGGLCAACRIRKGTTRASAHARGYGVKWRAWVQWWSTRLVTLDGVLCCGATHPGGPVTRDSECQSRGVLTTQRLQFDHEPPLTPSERQSQSSVCDALRIQALCIGCHTRKTQRERRARVQGRA